MDADRAESDCIDSLDNFARAIFTLTLVFVLHSATRPVDGSLLIIARPLAIVARRRFNKHHAASRVFFLPCHVSASIIATVPLVVACCVFAPRLASTDPLLLESSSVLEATFRGTRISLRILVTNQHGI